MRAMAKAMRGLAVLIMIIVLVTLCSFVEAYSTPTESAGEDKMSEEVVIDGYNETIAMTDIVNISHCSMANKICGENGRVMIVREIEIE